VDAIGSRYQYECPFGTYQPGTAQSFCLIAPPGSYVDSSLGTAQYEVMLCPSGTYNPNEGGANVNDCIEASKGHYVEELGQIAQEPCNFGTYQPGEGAASCLLADQGYYVPFMTSITQLMCPEGTSTLEQGAEDETFCLADFDGDGLPDSADGDDDDDGVPDQLDAFPYDSKEQLDSDGDGVGDAQEAEDQRQMLRMIVVLLLLLAITALVIRRRRQTPSLPEVEATEKPLPSIDDLWANGPELPFPPIPMLEGELESPKLNPTETRYPLEVWTENGYEWRTLSDGTLEWNNDGEWEVYSADGPQETPVEPAPAGQPDVQAEPEELRLDESEELGDETVDASPDDEGSAPTSDDDVEPSDDLLS
jgi:hypothetical protein